MAIDTEVVLKLFETLKDSNTALAGKVEKQTDALLALGSKLDKISNQLANAEKSFSDHNNKTTTAGECTEEIETTVKQTWGTVKKMAKSVNTMIIVVSVAFSLMAVAYFVVKGNVEGMIDKKLTKVQNDLESHDELTKEIEELRKTIRELRP